MATHTHIPINLRTNHGSIWQWKATRRLHIAYLVYSHAQSKLFWTIYLYESQKATKTAVYLHTCSGLSAVWFTACSSYLGLYVG